MNGGIYTSALSSQGSSEQVVPSSLPNWSLELEELSEKSVLDSTSNWPKFSSGK